MAGAKCKVLKPKKGYSFKKRGKGRMLLMRQGGVGIATITCACRGAGSCGLVIDPRTGAATCEGECSEGCRWVIVGLQGVVGPIEKA